jgi:hypothetical protein
MVEQAEQVVYRSIATGVCSKPKRRCCERSTSFPKLIEERFLK